MRRGCLVIIIALLTTTSLHAQTPAWKYQWRQGQVLNYKVEHITKITDIVAGSKVETSAKSNLVKCWQVSDVDDKGVATMNLTLVSLRNEQTRPNGDVLLFDSVQLDRSTPELKETLGKFIGQTLATLRVDPFGQVLEVKKGNPGQYESELPFTLTLPAAVPQPNQAWTRVVKISLPGKDPIEAVQRFTCKSVADNVATVAIATTLKTVPGAVIDQVPLLQKQGEGEIVFDIANGRVRSVSLNIDRTLPNHQGEGSSYRIVSSYREEYVER